MNERFTGMIINNTGADISGIFEDAIRNANGGDLPEEIADIFTAEVVNVNGENRIIVDFAD